MTMTTPVSVSGALANLRARGWAVAVHNDYRVDGVAHTFWLFTHAATGYFVKGEARTDEEALAQVETAIAGLRTSLDEQVAMETKLRAVAVRVLGEIRLATRWPCPECGREGPDAPLRSLQRVAVGADHKPLPDARVLFTGCWRCNEGDRLVALAEAAL
jgi:hypothetical protein